MRLILFTIISLFLTIGNLFAQVSSDKVVVAYLPTYRNWPNSVFTTDLSIVTHINVAFANPDWNGNINMPNGITTVVNEAHANNVKVLISLAGAGADANVYGNVLGNANLRNAFVNNLVQACLSYNLDGVDVDIEGDILNGTNVTATMYENFVVALRNALHAEGKLMTAALGTWFINQVTNTAAAQFDFINIMSYDAYGTWSGPGQHSSFQYMIESFNVWRNKNVPANKLVVGVPFYGWSWGSYGTRAWTFNEIVNQFPGSENNDQVGSGANVIYYNGIPTIKQKSEWAFENCLGVMYWEETQDANGSLSLLNAIGEVKGITVNPAVPINLATGKTVTVSSTEEGNNTATNINDRNYGTRWSSVYANNQWVAVDLDGTFLLDSVKIRWETALASAFEVQVSSNGNNWTTIQNVSNNSDLNNLFVFQGIEANHVRINCLTRATEYGFSIYELEVYGKAKSLPYHGVAINIPGIIQAEDYDLGGQGIAYNDVTPTNTHGAYRTDGVDIEDCTDAGGAYNLAGIEAGEWTQYSINVTETGFYEIKARVASVSGGRTFHIEVDGENVSGGMAVPNTGGWQTWQTVSSSSVLLSQGLHYLRLVMDSELFNINYLEVAQPIVTTVNNDLSLNTVKLFPNPSSGLIQYDLSNEFSEGAILEVFSVYGQLVYKELLSNSRGNFNINPSSAGNYLVKFTLKDKIITKHIVILN